MHLPLLKVVDVLENFANSNAKYLLVGSFEHNNVNINIQIGTWFRINLKKPPFDLQNYIESFEEIKEAFNELSNS